MIIYTFSLCTLFRNDFKPMFTHTTLFLASPLLDYIVLRWIQSWTWNWSLESLYLAEEVLVLLILGDSIKDGIICWNRIISSHIWRLWWFLLIQQLMFLSPLLRLSINTRLCSFSHCSFLHKINCTLGL